MSFPVNSHTANAAAVVVPIGAWVTGAEPYFAAFLTFVGLCWYAVLFYDRFFKKKV